MLRLNGDGVAACVVVEVVGFGAREGILSPVKMSVPELGAAGAVVEPKPPKRLDPVVAVGFAAPPRPPNMLPATEVAGWPRLNMLLVLAGCVVDGVPRALKKLVVGAVAAVVV